MDSKSDTHILAVVDDLFFQVKISDAAKRAGVRAVFSTTPDDALTKAQADPAAVIVDLNARRFDPMAVIRAVRGLDNFDGSLIAFVSHVQGDLKMEAQQAGCDMVLARSAFSLNLPQILKRHSGRAD